MKRWLGIFLALSAIVLLVPAGRSYAEPDRPWLPPSGKTPPPATTLVVTQDITGTEVLTGSVRIATALAKHFNRTVQEILALRAADLGFGNITKALFTALAAGVPLEQVLQLRAQGIGWGEIRQSLGLPAGMPHQSLGQIMGRGHGKDPSGLPPGQAKKQEGGWVPPGLTKKQGKSNGPNGKP